MVSLSPDAEAFCKLVLDGVPLMVQHSTGKFEILNEPWKQFIRENLCYERQSISYSLTDAGLAVMREVNLRGQPLVYVAFRFVRDWHLHVAIFVSDRTLMELRTTDGSTPLIGWAWERGQKGLHCGEPEKQASQQDIDLMRRMCYNPRLWTEKNSRGEFAEMFL